MTYALTRTYKVFFIRKPTELALTAFPDSAWTLRSHDERDSTLLAGIRAGENNLVRLPSCLFKATSGYVGQGGNTEQCFVRLTVAGAAQAGFLLLPCTEKKYLVEGKLLLPVELRCVNHTASTNKRILATSARDTPKMPLRPENNPLDSVLERVERLLVRYEELKRTNDLLVSQVETLTQERDSLKSRLQAARSRIDGLLDRLPLDIKDGA